MATRYFKLSFKFGNINDLAKMIRNYNDIYKGVMNSLKKVNNKDLLIAYKDAITDKLQDNDVHFGKRMDKIIKKFRVLKSSKTTDNQTFTFTNDVFEGKDIDFDYPTADNTHSVKGSTILRSLQSGRKSYVIPSTNNKSAKSPLVWGYGKKTMIIFHWKKKRRMVHVVSSKSKIYKKGLALAEAGAEAVSKYIDVIRMEIRKKMKGK